MKLQTTQKDGKLYGKLPDTGWVDLSPYINSSDFTVRSGFPVGIRKIGNRVYLKGIVYNEATLSGVSTIFSGISNTYRPSIQHTVSGCNGAFVPFSLWINTSGQLRYNPQNKQAIGASDGIDLSMISWFTD